MCTVTGGGSEVWPSQHWRSFTAGNALCHTPRDETVVFIDAGWIRRMYVPAEEVSYGRVEDSSNEAILWSYRRSFWVVIVEYCIVMKGVHAWGKIALRIA